MTYTQELEKALEEVSEQLGSYYSEAMGVVLAAARKYLEELK